MTSHSLDVKRLVIWLMLVVCAAAPTRAADNAAASDSTSRAVAADSMTGVENSIVKVFTTTRLPDLYRPWTKQPPGDYAGSGVVIEGKRILTSAHLVLYASQVEIQANQAGDKLNARVEAIAPGIDLAVLKLDDEGFFETHPALSRLNRLPGIKDSVMAYGYPRGGTSLSITKGIVSRIEFVSYNALVSGLRIQIDAAINPGNSGGPAVVGDKMIGLAFSHLGGSENIGYIIPNEEIDLFLKFVVAGKPYSKPALFDDFQTLENPALRSYLKLDKSVEGLVVHKPNCPSSDCPLKQWDVVTRIADTPVDDQGMIRIEPGLRVWFEYLVQRAAKDGKIPLTVVREGKTLELQVPVTAERPMVMRLLQGTYPSYFVYGPLVFSEASSEFVAGLTKSSGGRSLVGMLTLYGSSLITRILDRPAFPGEGLVVVSSPFFPHRLAKGYSNPAAEIVKFVNGTRIANLRHLVSLLRDAKEEFITFEFENPHAETLVFRRSEIMESTEGILTDNGVRSQGTPDMLEIWEKK